MSMDVSEKKKLSDKVIWLAQYLDNKANQFKRYVKNGVKFCTKDSKATRKTQTLEFVLLLKVVLLIMVY